MRDATDVLVVGAGPVGLLMAFELRRHGVGCRIIDKLAQPMNWVKALGVSQRTLEVWDDLGIVTEALDAGLNLQRRRVFVNREQVTDGDTAFPGEAPYRYFLSLPQPETERILAAHLARFGVHVERGVELRSFSDRADGVEATLGTAGGTEPVRCRYLVGCDGAHSTTRHGLQVPFEGGKAPVNFLLADVEIGWDISHGTSCLFLETRGGAALENLLVCIPYRDRSDPTRPRYRLTTMAQPVSAVNWEATAADVQPEAASELTLAQVQEVLGRFAPIPATVHDLRWSSVFRISHRIVPRYRAGRVFLAGDAAHIHPPTGGQGMNTGLQDAYNLAWKLALDVKGLAHPDLLDSYNAERQPVGREVVERTVQRSVNIADRSAPDDQGLRDDSQLYVSYRTSPWVSERVSRLDALAGGPRAGDRAPDATGLCRDGVSFTLRLFDLLRGTHHTLLLFGTATVAGGVEALQRRHGDGLRVYEVVAPTSTRQAAGVCPRVLDSDGHCQRNFGVTGPAAYLIRPDGYVGFRSDGPEHETFEEYFGRVFRSRL
jgi:2-polyprenyl-6-methoxyphenol hydroxylase-like FAD-dependent oxidoreductase